MSTATLLLSRLSHELIVKIVRLISAGESGKVEDELKALKAFSWASRAMRGATMGVIGHMMSLSPESAVPTSEMMKNLAYRAFVDALERSARESRSVALMPRLAALGADPRSAGVADELREKLAASIKRATVRGEPMYANPDALASNVIRKLKSGTKLPSPVLRESVFCTVHKFATLEQSERTRHAEKYGPMCLWDMSAAKIWHNGFTTLNDHRMALSSDLYWDTSEATSMENMFTGNFEFRGDLSTWDVSRVTNMNAMFSGSGIAGTIEHWNVGNVETAYGMFENAMGLSTEPELDLSRWNIGICRDFTSMFKGSAVVDSGVGKWKLLEDADTTNMFAGTKFKGDLTRWREDHRNKAMPAGQTGFGGRQKIQQTLDEVISAEFARVVREGPRASGGSCAVC
jgi:surface protein